jgi:hypothetical protein
MQAQSFCQMQKLQQVYNQDFIFGLGNHLAGRPRSCVEISPEVEGGGMVKLGKIETGQQYSGCFGPR